MNPASALSSFIWVVLFTAAASAALEKLHNRFDGHKEYRVKVNTEERLSILRTVEQQSTDGKSAKSTQTLIDKQDTNEKPTSMNWTAYHRLDTIHGWLDKLAKMYPNHVEVIVAGRSYEGRLQKGIKITFNKNNPGIFIEGGIHAREWISPAVVTYVINEILNSKNVEFTSFAQSYNWYIFPVTNPDGYEYTHTTDRLWRKTRHPYANNCVGADPNRNWNYKWLANGGASTNPCDEDYAGPKPFSEIEIKALSDYIYSVRNDFYIYLSLHSYGQQILLPYGYTTTPINNYHDSMLVGNISAKALAKRYGTHFDVGSVAGTLYVDSGTSTDYVKGVYDTPFVYCYELRDNGTHGDLLPAEQIIPSGLEFVDSIVALIGETRRLGYPKNHKV